MVAPFESNIYNFEFSIYHVATFFDTSVLKEVGSIFYKLSPQ